MYVYLDLETTGFTENDEILEIAIIDDNGNVLLNSLVKPSFHDSWPEAQRVNHISPEMVADYLDIWFLEDEIKAALTGNDLVIYNAKFDTKFLRQYMNLPASINCCMNAWSSYCGIYDKQRNCYKKFKLTDASRYIGYQPPGAAHRALSDCYMTRALWHHMQENPKRNSRRSNYVRRPTYTKQSYNNSYSSTPSPVFYTSKPRHKPKTCLQKFLLSFVALFVLDLVIRAGVFVYNNWLYKYFE